MADTWVLVTPDAEYTLNASFHAPQYEPGGVGAPGALRRDDRHTIQRSGDALRTPGPLVLQGRVWRDDRNAALVVAELNAIRAAIAACTSVERHTQAGVYAYEDLAGGATPEVTPDGLGGWIVGLELWPGRAEPYFTPLTPGIPTFITAATSTSDPSPSVTTGGITVPNGVRPGDLMLLHIAPRSGSGIPTAAIGVNQPGWETLAGQASLVGHSSLLVAKTVTTETPGDLVTWGLSNPNDNMRYLATLLVYRAAGPITITAVEGTSGTTQNGVAPSADTPVPGLRVSFWAAQVHGEAPDDGWTPPAGTVVRSRGASEGSPGSYKFTTLAVEQPVTEGPTGSLTAVQAHGFSSGGTPYWMWRFTVVLAVSE